MATQDKWHRPSSAQRRVLFALASGDRVVGDGEGYWLQGCRRRVAIGTVRSLVRHGLIVDPRVPLFERDSGRLSDRGEIWFQAAGGSRHG